MIDPSEYLKNNSLRIVVKPGRPGNRIKGYDSNKQALEVDIKAPAQGNKANIEVIKYFSRLLKNKVRIKKGLKSKEKTLCII